MSGDHIGEDGGFGRFNRKCPNEDESICQPGTGLVAGTGCSEIQPKVWWVGRISGIVRFYFFKFLLPVDSPIISMTAGMRTAS